MAMRWTWHLSKEPNLPHAIVQNSSMARASVDLGQGLDAVQTEDHGTKNPECATHVTWVYIVRSGRNSNE